MANINLKKLVFTTSSIVRFYKRLKQQTIFSVSNIKKSKNIDGIVLSPKLFILFTVKRILDIKIFNKILIKIAYMILFITSITLLKIYYENYRFTLKKAYSAKLQSNTSKSDGRNVN